MICYRTPKRGGYHRKTRPAVESGLARSPQSIETCRVDTRMCCMYNRYIISLEHEWLQGVPTPLSLYFDSAGPHTCTASRGGIPPSLCTTRKHPRDTVFTGGLIKNTNRPTDEHRQQVVAAKVVG